MVKFVIPNRKMRTFKRPFGTTSSMQQGKPNSKTSEEDVQSVLKLVEYDSKLHRNYNISFVLKVIPYF